MLSVYRQRKKRRRGISSGETSKVRGRPGAAPQKKIFKINNNEINQKIHYNKRNNSITPPTLPMTLPLSRTTFVHHRSFRFDTSESSLYHTIILSILSIRWFHFNLKLEFRGLKVSKLQKY